jgi:hypothetical protein
VVAAADYHRPWFQVRGEDETVIRGRSGLIINPSASALELTLWASSLDVTSWPRALDLG